jgi:peptidoglycan/xylan/chitin deacetylase (PgdA/CDA1 family)
VATVHIRQLQTRPYIGDKGAIIFMLDHINTDNASDTVNGIIRLFANNSAPLEVDVAPSLITPGFSGLTYLRDYSDAGIVDISFDSSDIHWFEEDTSRDSAAYRELLSSLQNDREQLKSYFGDSPVACVLQTGNYQEANYSLIQDSGFRILATEYAGDFNSSKRPLSWSGEIDPKGLYRLPIVENLEYASTATNRLAVSARASAEKNLLAAVDQSINKIGTAVIEIQAASFMGKDAKPDAAKLAFLSNLIKACQQHGELTTFESWSLYMSRWASNNSAGKRIIPTFNGGKAIIFRIDDVSKGWHEDVVEEIIKLFQANGVPLDVGVVSNIDGTDSFEMPWLQKYIDQGIIGISVHGYDWTYYQLDTTRSGLTYDFIKYKLVKARDQYLQYFGFAPVALTVPTDYFDETGYRAAQEAGFKIFATQIILEPHPATHVTVDYYGQPDPNGMYRVPTASDVCNWDSATGTWGDIIDISKLETINDYCTYHDFWDEAAIYNDFGSMLCGTMAELGVAAVGIHPQALTDKEGKLDQAKLAKLDKIIKWCKTLATITTYEAWYNYTSATK